MKKLICIISVGVLLLTGCKKEGENLIIGEWEVTEIVEYTENIIDFPIPTDFWFKTITFHKKGKCTIITSDGKTQKGKYSLGISIYAAEDSTPTMLEIEDITYDIIRLDKKELIIQHDYITEENFLYGYMTITLWKK